MDISIGKLRIDLTPVDAQDYSFYTGLDLVLFVTRRVQRARRFYRWDCAAQQGTPMQRPSILLRTEIEIPKRVEIGPFPSSGYSIDPDQMWVAAAGFDTREDFALEVQKVFPPIKVPIDWDRLWKPYKDIYSLNLYVYPVFDIYFGRPHGLHELDRIFVAIPKSALIYSEVTGRCAGGVLPNGAAVASLTEARDPATIEGTLAELMEAAARDLDETEEQTKRIIEKLGLDHDLAPHLPKPPQDDGEGH